MPGCLAQRFLGGQRVRYVAPMRLFLVLNLLTFFIARIAVHASDADSEIAPAPDTSQATAPQDFAHARTPARVEALRRQLVDTLTQTRTAVPTGIARDSVDAGIARAVPSALLVLVPLFALLLQVFYVRSGQVYLEHLVVALYSRAFLCLTLLTQLLLSLLSDAPAHVASPITWSIGVVQFGLTLWMRCICCGCSGACTRSPGRSPCSSTSA